MRNSSALSEKKTHRPGHSFPGSLPPSPPPARFPPNPLWRRHRHGRGCCCRRCRRLSSLPGQRLSTAAAQHGSRSWCPCWWLVVLVLLMWVHSQRKSTDCYRCTSVPLSMHSMCCIALRRGIFNSQRNTCVAVLVHGERERENQREQQSQRACNTDPPTKTSNDG